jgi:glutamate 5-kinase
METERLPARIVVKVGTSTLTHGTGKPNLQKLDELARSISDLKNAGSEVILVSSGAIAVGAAKLGMPGRPTELRLKQAAASVGQCELIHIYDKLFSEYGYTVGQILLTGEDVEHPARRENLLLTFLSLIDLGAVLGSKAAHGLEQL